MADFNFLEGFQEGLAILFRSPLEVTLETPGYPLP